MLHTLAGTPLVHGWHGAVCGVHDGTAATLRRLCCAMEEAATAEGQRTENRNSVRFVFSASAAGDHPGRYPGATDRAALGWGRRVLELHKVRQHTLPTPGAAAEDNRFVMSLGPWPAGPGGREASWGAQGLLVIDQAEQIFRFAILPSSSEGRRGLLAAVAGVFSAPPVRLEIERQRPELLVALLADSDFPLRPHGDCRSDPAASGRCSAAPDGESGQRPGIGPDRCF